MNYKNIGAFFCCLLLLVSSCKKEKRLLSPEDQKYQIFQAVLDSVFEDNEKALGLIVHIESPDKNLSWSGVVGMSDKDSDAVLTKDQPVLIASNTKTYVAVAILRLIEEGEIKLDDPIFKFISHNSKLLLSKSGYDVFAITIRDLLSHTSGILDYAGTQNYLKKIKTNPDHRWSRTEQIELAMSLGNPLGVAGDVFAYADTNYLLLTEVIETISHNPFYYAIRELIDYEKINTNATWFSTLETYPEHVKPMAHQYFSSQGLDSYTLNHSFDLYGGGGMASTAKDLALFSHSLFNNKVFKNPKTLDLLYTKAKPEIAGQGNYFLGLSSESFNGLKGYGHNGFWGTAVNFFPEINTSIAVVVLDRDQKHLRADLNKLLLKALKMYKN